MHKVILSFLLLSAFKATNAQEISPVKPRANQLSQSYGFVLGQKYSLDSIIEEFPSLSKSGNLATAMFNSSAIGEGFTEVEKELKKIFGIEWNDYKVKLTKGIEKTIANNKFTKTDAEVFIKEVKRRAEGELNESIRAVLLSANPRYKNNPELEIIEGWKQVFKSEGHPKAKGANFSVSLPASWHKRKGERPNVINSYKSNFGHGEIMCMFLVKSLPLPKGYQPTEKEIKEMFQPAFLKSMTPKGNKYIDAKYLVLDGKPAGMLVSDATRQRLDLIMTIRLTSFLTYYKGQLITLQLTLPKRSDTSKSLDELHKEHINLYLTIANSLVLNEQYIK